MKNTWIAIIVVVIIALGAFAWKWYAEKNMVAEPLVSDANAVLVSDQQPGNETVVSYAKLSKPGFVVVTATDATGAKTVLGASALLPAGEHKNVRISHNGSSAGTTVAAAIVIDDGDGVFTEETELVFVAEDTAMINADATLNLDLSDEELAALLDEAGYDAMGDDEAMEGDAMDDSSDTMMEDDSMHEDDAMMEEPEEMVQ